MVIVDTHHFPPDFSADAWKEDEIDTWMKGEFDEFFFVVKFDSTHQ